MNTPIEATAICWQLRIGTTDDMSDLGQAFARVAHLDKRPRDLPYGILHIGLKADMNAGKTTFAKGFLSAFKDREILDRSFFRWKEQSYSRTSVAGCIRHYDARLEDHLVLPAWRNHVMETENLPGTDLAENPTHDFNAWPPPADYIGGLAKSDYLVSIFRERSTPARSVEILCRPELTRSDGFVEFLREAKRFAAPKEKPLIDKQYPDSYYLR